MSGEKRKEPRTAVRFAAEVRFSSWALFQLIYSVNVSRGGMSVELADAPAVGTPLTVRLNLPNGQQVSLESVVRHVTPLGKQAGGKPQARYQVGVEFSDTQEKKLEQIDELVRRHTSAMPARK